MSTQNAPAPTQVASSSLPVWLDPLSKFGALVLLAIYAIGYLVTSIHLAKLGMGFANPLKPRTGAAGVLSCILISIPVYLSERVISGEGLPIDSMPVASLSAKFYKFTHFYHVCFLVALPLSIVFGISPNPLGWRMWTSVACILTESAFVAFALNSKAVEDWVGQHLPLFAWLYFALMTLYVILTAASVVIPFSQIQVVGWLFGCGVFYQVLRPRSFQLAAWNWPTLLTQTLTPIFILGSFVYPHAKNEWGGGQPISVTIHFTKDSPIYTSSKLGFQLVDETDAGFYLLAAGNKHAIFVPRTSIAAISFSEDAKELP